MMVKSRQRDPGHDPLGDPAHRPGQPGAQGESRPGRDGRAEVPAPGEDGPADIDRRKERETRN